MISGNQVVCADFQPLSRAALKGRKYRPRAGSRWRPAGFARVVGIRRRARIARSLRTGTARHGDARIAGSAGIAGNRRARITRRGAGVAGRRFRRRLSLYGRRQGRGHREAGDAGGGKYFVNNRSRHNTSPYDNMKIFQIVVS